MKVTAARCRYFLIVCLLMTQVVCLFGQAPMVISVYDSASARPLPDAIVRVMPLSRASKGKGTVEITEKSGQINLTYTEPLIVHVSYLGYNSIFDTIYSAQNKSYQIKRTAANIDDVVVTGQYNAGSAKASVYNMEVYTEKDFREKGATNLREALEGSLNIDMSQDAIFGSGLSLQGIPGEGVKIMVDGVPLVGRQNGVLDLSQVNLSNIERVEIIKGPMSAIYGSDAMGGVVNLITKTNQTEKYDINLKGYYESVGQYNVSLNGGVHLGKSQVFVSAGRNFFGGYSVVDTERHKDWLPKEQYFADAKYIYTTGKFKISAGLSFFRELMLDRGNREPNTTYAFDEHLLTFRPVGTLAATIPIKDYSKIDLLLAYSGYVNFVNYYKKDLVTLAENVIYDPGQPQDTSIYHDIVGRAVYTLTARNRIVSCQFGVDINQEYTVQNTLSNGKQQMGDYAVFGSVLIKPVIGLDIQPALRFGYNTKFNTPLIPSINIKYDIDNHFSVRASYGIGYRAPSLQELYLDFHDSNHNINGNDSLRPEKGNSVNLDLTYRIQHGKHSFKLNPSGFFNKITNKIDYLLINASSSPQVYEEFNLNQYTNAGGELSAEYKWDRLSIGSGLTYTWYKISITGTSPTYINAPATTAKVSYLIPKAEVKVIVMYKYTGRTPLSAFAGGNETEYGTRNPFNTLDVSLSRDFWKDRIQLTCGGKNLFNVNSLNTPGAVPFGHNDSNSTLIMWGRTFFISLNLHFAK